MRTFGAAAVACILLATPAHAAVEDQLLGLVPARADALVVVDHQRLARHKAGAKLRNFIHDQGGARGLQAVVALGVVPGTALQHSITFNVGRAEADLLAGPIDAAALEARSRTKLGPSFAAGEAAGRHWFTVARGRRFVALDKGLAVVGSEKMVQRVLDRAGGKGKPVTKRQAFSSMRAPAKRAKAPLWAAVWVPRSARDRLREQGASALASITRARFHAVGDAAMTVHGEAFTGSADEAIAAKAAVEGKIEQATAGSLTLKMLGVTALARALTLKARGKVVAATLPLSAAQVDLIATTGGKVIAILKAKAK